MKSKTIYTPQYLEEVFSTAWVDLSNHIHFLRNMIIEQLRDKDSQLKISTDDIQRMDENEYQELTRKVHEPDFIELESLTGWDEDVEDEQIRDRIENVAEVDRIMNLLNLLISATINKDVSSIKSLTPEIALESNEMSLNVEDKLEQIDDCVQRISINNTSLIYIPSQPKIYIPQLIQVINSSLIPQLKVNPDLMYKIHPRKFEELVAEIFSRQGFEVELTKETRDGGRDIIALTNLLNVGCKYIIECKRYAPTHKVSIGIVQRLLGVKISDAANKAILVTTSSYSLDAKKFASNHLWDLSLKDHDDILSWIKDI